MSQPIILLASERTGSNLLRTLLANHPSYTGPRSPHFFQKFVGANLLPQYGDLAQKENCGVLFEDMQRLANIALYDWKLSINFEPFYTQFKPTCFVDMVMSFYQAKAEQDGNESFICKEINLYKFADMLLEANLSCHWIYLYRDVRDVVLSKQKSPEFKLTLYQAAKRWNTEQENYLALSEKLGKDSYSISYEELTADTPNHMRSILNHFNLPLDEACFSTQAPKKSDATSQPLWENLSKPIMQSNTKKYRKELSAQQIEIIETLAKLSMEKLGYELETDAAWKMSLLYRIREKRERKFRKSQQRESMSPEKIERQRLQKELRKTK